MIGLICLGLVLARQQDASSAISRLIQSLSALKGDASGLVQNLPESAEWYTMSTFPPDNRMVGGANMDELVKGQLSPWPEALRKLVAVGPAAVPALCRQLGDTRPTGLVFTAGQWLSCVPAPFFDVSWSNRFDVWRARYLKTLPELDEGRLEVEGRSVPAVTLSVGDLCYLALGQIVNRRYNPLMVGAFPNTVYHSGPTVEPRVIEWARAAWGHATPESIKASLIEDLLSPDDRTRDADAVRHLKVYFPSALEGAVLRKFRLPLKFDMNVKDPSFNPTHELLTALSDFDSAKLDDQCALIVRKLRAKRAINKEVADGEAVPLLARLARKGPRFASTVRAYVDLADQDPSFSDPYFKRIRALLDRAP